MGNKNSEHYSSSVLILLQDCGVSVLASLLSILLVRWMSEPISGFSLLVGKWLLYALAASFIGFFVTRNYRAVRRYTTVRTVNTNLMAILIKELILMAVLLFHWIKLPSTSLAVVALLADILLSAAFLLYLRLSARLFSLEKPEEVREMVGRKNTLIAGTGTASLQLAEQVNKDGEHTVIGLLTDDPKMAGRVIGNWVVYAVEDISSIDSLQWKVGGIDCILFPRDFHSSGPDQPASGKGNGGTMKETIPQTDGMTRVGHAVKRLIDLTGSGILLLVFSPLFLLCAIAVKLEDKGKVIYAQERIGKNGKPFYIYKLRTMREDAETVTGPALFGGDEDPRLTRVGRFLRAHHLDELPQLYNVFRGDMSFIGYRPERQFYIDQILDHDPRYRYLYQIRPGVTSYATLYNGYTDTMDKMLTRLDLDLFYLRNHSLLFDAKVLGLTFLKIVAGKKF